MRLHSSSSALIFVIGLAFCQTEPTRPCTGQKLAYSLGKTEIRIGTEDCLGSDLFLINLHDDENTGVEAGLQLIREEGGHLVQLQHDGSRLISFFLEGTDFKFDPNRMFTDQGARLTLEKYGPCTDEALQTVRKFATAVLSICRFDEISLAVTLHNNDDQGYSAASYSKGGVYANDALKVHLEPDADPDDFFFLTDGRLYELLRDRHFNVVLQDNEHVTDDGSLSVLAGRRGIPYINVESEKGHLQQQLKMLREVYAIYGN